MAAMSDARLTEIARRRIRDGSLPAREPAETWGGRGSGAVCALCEKTIEEHQFEYEVETSVRGAVQTLRFHVACESAWSGACRLELLLQR
jgi:hypothetical protein